MFKVGLGLVTDVGGATKSKQQKQGITKGTWFCIRGKRTFKQRRPEG